jgi:hypothetical protein
MTMPDVDKIMRYELGDLSPDETVDFFAELVRTRVAWQLQGSYGRTAAALIDEGWLDDEGNVLRYPGAQR